MVGWFDFGFGLVFILVTPALFLRSVKTAKPKGIEDGAFFSFREDGVLKGRLALTFVGFLPLGKIKASCWNIGGVRVALSAPTPVLDGKDKGHP